MPKLGVISISYVGEINDWQGDLTWTELMQRYLDEWALEDLNGLLARIKSLGFGYVELYKGHAGFETWGEGSPQMIRRLFDQHQLELPAYCVGGLTTETDMERHFRFADALGCNLLTGTLGREPELVDQVQEQCERWNKRYAIEPHGKETTLSDPQEILAAIERHPLQLGACPDSGWFAREGFDPVEAFDLLKDHTWHTHLKDYDYQKGRACAPGDGDVNMAQILRILKDWNYDGVYSIEWEAPYDPTDDLEDARRFIEETLAEV